MYVTEYDTMTYSIVIFLLVSVITALLVGTCYLSIALHRTRNWNRYWQKVRKSEHTQRMTRCQEQSKARRELAKSRAEYNDLKWELGELLSNAE